jgi:MoxR-like ATPase
LLEDVPGVGKTLVGKAIARSLSGSFHRIQFTPDLLPADITGSSFYPARFSPMLCWPTRLTVRLRERKARC